MKLVTITEQDLVRLVLKLQWQVAVCLKMGAKPKYPYSAFVIEAQTESAEKEVKAWLAENAIDNNLFSQLQIKD